MQSNDSVCACAEDSNGTGIPNFAETSMSLHDSRANGKHKVAYRSSADGRLLWWDEVPKELQFNRYIASGYRANLTYCQCLGSMFGMHNETGAVHALPASGHMHVAQRV